MATQNNTIQYIPGEVALNTTSVVCNETSEIYEKALLIDKILTPFIYAVGFPGNILSFLIWIRPKMRHSSGVYLAALALADFIFLLLHLNYELNANWGVNTLNFPVICEGFTIVFLTFQYIAPLLVLAFTVERYISICHPFKRERFCTTRRAQIVSLSLAFGCLATCGIQGYFWTFDSVDGCGLRETVVAGDNKSLWSIWSWITETLMFLVVPLSVLVFNILVIKEAKRISAYEQKQLHGRSQKTSATTIMLLVVSFYLIITTLPVTIAYTSGLNFPEGETCDDPAWPRYWQYRLVRTVVEEIGITHFALNFYIYMITGKQFRNEFQKMFMNQKKSYFQEKDRTEYTTLRTSIKKDISVRISTNGKSSNGIMGHNTEETNV
ncbi:FMRFamide peptide receptor frpr-18-like [Mya arenaria]|uniref:FMRFamide peptide receptor frpr-18-like n=1 Tax=Mya arenaria TaxID=6604 RepID=UPI0022E96DC3|nr:FMRFamide peptide receptor frpr-18-like [Mya arenaria]XP_052797014.1 FMRFamide peptide receptor frpr-18-like [Mya arenaria]XP_052797015.1 FMRFamide peptide receptor frpr-18-like [Mya arenaria]XP_052797016.1 FMRFamide peptide receptor frpr-18-like [Mya arenaria]XP_052797017.1 FMRFamide peptide receptor frpr-18-like [Mya arenaria]XP_052797018.1 FMRFamide peptide receptor frpr-18-like [Mya arenaria]